jgi:hypothetical protein
MVRHKELTGCATFAVGFEFLFSPLGASTRQTQPSVSALALLALQQFECFRMIAAANGSKELSTS